MRALLLLAALWAIPAMASDQLAEHKDKCVLSYPLEYYVVAKHPGGLIELNSPVFGHALVKTKLSTFKAGPLNIRFKYKKMKTMPLANGFDAEVRLWEECQ